MSDKDVLDVTDVFPGCLRAERQDLNVLILRRLTEPHQRFDGKRGSYELEYRWLSRLDPALVCVRGNEFSYWLAKEINGWQAHSLFDFFQLC